MNEITEALLEDISVLSGRIGVRFTGTKNDRRACKYIEQRFADIGLAIKIMEYQVMGWRLESDPILRIDGEDIACWPYVYSASTSANHCRGTVRYSGKECEEAKEYRPFERSKFAFSKYSVEDGTNRILAEIVSTDFPSKAKAAAWGVKKLPLTTPTVLIGEQDGQRLYQQVRTKKQVEAYLKIKTEYVPNSKSSNIVAVQTGNDESRKHEFIVIGAHYDTVYNSPGAVDNASGIACLLSLSKYCRNRNLKRSLIFAAYGAEEIGFIGSKQHVDDLRVHDQLANVRFMLNLDMLSCNQPNWIHASEDFLASESVKRAVRQTSIEEKYGPVEIVTPPWPGDQKAFYDRGIACVQFTWKGYKYPYTHLPSDTIDKTNEETLYDSFCLACQLIENVDSML